MQNEEILNEIEQFCDVYSEAGCRYCPLELCCESCESKFENDDAAMNAAYKVIKMLKAHRYLWRE